MVLIRLSCCSAPVCGLCGVSAAVRYQLHTCGPLISPYPASFPAPDHRVTTPAPSCHGKQDSTFQASQPIERISWVVKNPLKHFHITLASDSPASLWDTGVTNHVKTFSATTNKNRKVPLAPETSSSCTVLSAHEGGIESWFFATLKAKVFQDLELVVNLWFCSQTGRSVC